MSLGALLLIIGLLVWVLTASTTLGIILVVIGVVLLLAAPATTRTRRWYW